MRAILPAVVSAGRERSGPYGTTERDGNQGRFSLVCPDTGRRLVVLASDGRDWREEGLLGEPWEHVSVSVWGRSTCPSWPEMEWVRTLFLSEEETVLQFHPPLAVKVNHHPGCLHLWRPTKTTIPLPPSICVGPTT